MLSTWAACAGRRLRIPSWLRQCHSVLCNDELSCTFLRKFPSCLRRSRLEYICNQSGREAYSASTLMKQARPIFSNVATALSNHIRCCLGIIPFPNADFYSNYQTSVLFTKAKSILIFRDYLLVSRIVQQRITSATSQKVVEWDREGQRPDQSESLIHPRIRIARFLH